MSAQIFENRRLRKVANYSCAIPLLWIGVNVAASASATAGPALAPYFPRGMIVTIWVVLLTHAMFYGHLLMTRFQMSLLGFMVFILIWGNAAALSWVAAGWEAGITILLASAAWVAWSLTWSHSVTALLNVTRLPGKAALLLLGLTMPVAAVVLGVSVLWVATLLEDKKVLVPLAMINLLCVALLIIAGVLSFKARCAARALIAAAGEREPQPNAT